MKDKGFKTSRTHPNRQAAKVWDPDLVPNAEQHPIPRSQRYKLVIVRVRRGLFVALASRGIGLGLCLGEVEAKSEQSVDNIHIPRRQLAVFRDHLLISAGSTVMI